MVESSLRMGRGSREVARINCLSPDHDKDDDDKDKGSEVDEDKKFVS